MYTKKEDDYGSQKVTLRYCCKVNLRKRIALGDPGCEVTIFFQPNDEEGLVYKDILITPEHGTIYMGRRDDSKLK
ncbi:hypothetical protein ACJROX_16430 [Pseudalkalibacillus sp. A8]|uniref:hypothetical protein n=1 Tax=Pseudalkalibacillus sp. A8 TaxID=3382641 RepID=UPI0038B56F22